jgi:hypothetical protein
VRLSALACALELLAGCKWHIQKKCHDVKGWINGICFFPFSSLELCYNGNGVIVSTNFSINIITMSHFEQLLSAARAKLGGHSSISAKEVIENYGLEERSSAIIERNQPTFVTPQD